VARQGNLTVTAEDYERNGAIFFGDRPLDDPGYSKITLIGKVGVPPTNTAETWNSCSRAPKIDQIA
jgi:hypothetical protein